MLWGNVTKHDMSDWNYSHITLERKTTQHGTCSINGHNELSKQQNNNNNYDTSSELIVEESFQIHSVSFAMCDQYY